MMASGGAAAAVASAAVRRKDGAAPGQRAPADYTRLGADADAVAGKLDAEEDDDDDGASGSEEPTETFFSKWIYKRYDPNDQHAREVEEGVRDHMEYASCKWFWSKQLVVHHVYDGSFMTCLVVFFILTNFFVEIVQRMPGKPAWHWREIENFFNVVFLIEVCIHLYAEWMLPWMRSPGNWFDFMVVMGGSLDLLGLEFPGIDVVLMLRAVRIFRLLRAFRIFGKVEALHKILNSLTYGAPGMLNALLIVMIFMIFYAVIAVDSFSGLYCEEDAEPYRNMEEYITPRGVCFGKDYYGDTVKAMYTMFQILTGESWSEAAVRPIIYRFESSQDSFAVLGTVLFFLSFVVINSFVLINVVVAVLLGGMSAGEAASKPTEDPAELLRDVEAEIQDAIEDVREKATQLARQLKERR